MSAIVMAAGSAVIFLSECRDDGVSVSSRLMSSVFQAVSASTTDGFNSVDIGALAPGSITIIMILMFVGASPGGTGGGIKTTTLGVLARFDWRSITNGDEHIDMWGREFPVGTARKACSVLLWFIAIAVADMLVLSAVEDVQYLPLLFEAVSALGNTGLSMGATSSLGATAKLFLSITMFIGRVGPLTLGLSLLENRRPPLYRFPEEDVFVG